MTASCIEFDLGYEYINDADMELAMAAERRWQEKELKRQARNYGRVIRKVLDSVGVRRFMSWF